MRLFVALNIPEETRSTLRLLLDDFARICRGARWVRPEGIHITLKFIGHVDNSSLPEIQKALSRVRHDKPFHVAFRHFGFFPNEKHPRVFFVGIEADKGLATLAANIENQLAPLGIAKEERTFQPHLTLARFKTTEGLSELRKKIASLPTQDFGGGEVSEFHLYQSMLKSGGAVYTKLSTYHFAN
ncbi:MAG TPA: RNA 2',3'-cyclic phosphodiesterase [Candidatus Acidoferrales bacterium]|nr:RNA 2',3'-cyclic phosphodiesterase [Candidatus Acidoferrales bacterium]